ncbi:MAG: DNA mismatch repair protein MutS [Gemmobacter sp.]
MMAQYLKIKAEYPDAILFYRMGDFYEMFFDDAAAAASALDIALTKRGQHMGQDIPMCGVPVVRGEEYLQTLIRKGFRVAIAEQMEDPAAARKRGAKAVVRREVVRLVTPGTLTEDSLLDARRSNFLAAYATARDEGALAWVDVSTGEMRVAPCPVSRLPAELARLSPSELLLPEEVERSLFSIAGEAGVIVTERPRSAFDSVASDRRLRAVWSVASLDAFGRFSRAEISALGALADYLDLTQRGRMPLLRRPVREGADRLMQIDAATRRNLELTQALSGGREGSLLWSVDRTLTAGGARLLDRRLSGPSRDLGLIRDRLAAVAYLVSGGPLRDRLRDMLRGVPDIERAVSRLALDRGGPRDLAAVRQAIAQAEEMSAAIPADAPRLLSEAGSALAGQSALAGHLASALVAAPPLQVRDGGFVAEGFDHELDETRRLRDEGRGVIAALQAEYAAETGIPSLKIRHNNVLGYFVETTSVHAPRMLAQPLSDRFLHRQTTANQVRFTTLELAELESRILNAADHALALEKAIFERLSAAVLQASSDLARISNALSEIDVLCALAEVAVEGDWSLPLVEEGNAFLVAGGRHPVVEQALRRNGQSFVANDCALSDGDTPAIWLLTGPNMGGKSTFLRQNALIALLAQAGSFVPADSARIGVVSQLFSRVGAADDLARGRSTFMVEMVETAAILNQADSSALVILDEIGRGTATWDGLSIAWSVLEYLHDVNRCRALFATHYHELTSLAARLPGARNATVAVREWGGELVFLHEVRPGAADRSYGVQVARLAGLPGAVIDRARAVLELLERDGRDTGARTALIDELPLFAAARATEPTHPVRSAEADLIARIRALNPDVLSPKQALDLLYELRADADRV